MERNIDFQRSRGEALAEALADGLLRPSGLVATNFLPHVDLVRSSRLELGSSQKEKHKYIIAIICNNTVCKKILYLTSLLYHLG